MVDDVTRNSLPDGWALGLLGDDAIVKGRIGWRGYKKSDLRDSGPIVIGGNNVKSQLYLDLSEVKHLSREKYEESPDIQLKQGDVLLVQRGNGLADTAYFDGSISEATINPTLIILSHFEGDARYLFYYLTSPQGRYRVLSLASGSSVPALYQNHVKQLTYPKPPPNEQRAIAHILGTIDDKIELNRQMNQTLEAIARAIFKSWFIDFDPVHAKAAGQQPPGLDPETAALFPDTFIDSPLGPIPDGWGVHPVGEIVDVVGGTTPSTKNPAYWDGGSHYFATPKDLSQLDSPILLATERAVTDAGLATISSGLLPPGTVLLSSRAPVGYLAIAREPVCVNQGFIAMVCDGPVSSYYMLNWAAQNMTKIKQRASGTTFAEISKRNFRPIPALLPSQGPLSAYDDQVIPLYTKIESNDKESRTLAELRDTLLPKLISGELRVPDAQGFMEDSLCTH